MSNSSISHTVKTLSGITTLGQSGPGAMAMKEYAIFPKAGASTFNSLMSSPGYSLGQSYPCEQS